MSTMQSLQNILYDPTKEATSLNSHRLFQIGDNKVVKLVSGNNAIPVEDWEKVIEYSGDTIDMLVHSKSIIIQSVEESNDPTVLNLPTERSTDPTPQTTRKLKTAP